MKTIWLLEIHSGVYESFSCVEKAKDFAYKKLIKWGYNPNNKNDKEIFDELEKSYKDKKHSGFWIDELFWCSEINFHDD